MNLKVLDHNVYRIDLREIIIIKMLKILVTGSSIENRTENIL